MKKFLASAATAAGIMAMGAANASLVDLTASATYENGTASPITLDVDGTTVSIVAAPDNISASEGLVDTSSPFCQAGGGMFACDVDGLGIGNDEINGMEEVTVTFDRAVNLISLTFLDLFEADLSDSEESVMVFANGSEVPIMFDAEEDAQFGNFGNGFAQFSIGDTADLGLVTSLRFVAGPDNDGFGTADFALAGIEFDAIPLPGAALLFATAAAGGALRLRRKAA